MVKCEGCGRRFVARALTDGRCYACTQRVEQLARSGRGGRKPGAKNLPKPERQCAAIGCGEWFTPSRSSHIYHSAACARRQQRADRGANTRWKPRVSRNQEEYANG